VSQQDLWAVVGRAKVDTNYASQLFQDFDGAVKAAGYLLTRAEMQLARASMSDPQGTASAAIPDLQQFRDTFKLQQDEMRKRIVAQSNRMIDMNEFTANLLKDTMKHSASTYRKVTMMNQVMFWMGVSLFGIAVAFGLVRHIDTSALFAGLGTVSFIGFFFLGPIQKTQVALSNLIQAEIAFMNYFEQMGFIESYAGMPRDDAPGLLDPVRIEKASEMLQRRSQETIELLQRYVEEDEKVDDRPGKQKPIAAVAG
jgi:ABC-type multidrug transport system fused ATPase/permease subunit